MLEKDLEMPAGGNWVIVGSRKLPLIVDVPAVVRNGYVKYRGVSNHLLGGVTVPSQMPQLNS